MCAQDQPPPRASVGIALSGGGAFGLAQIGVLKYFEDHHIPIDYIGGTSMGGLIGGFYATGLTPSELEEIVRQFWPVSGVTAQPQHASVFQSG